ncbi:hypothetical protein Leryth_025027 [Lithospermum erythrorhizon]|nr:hypothetical protein Leryth_025027 [Lithospermum erythrorhizon]
MMALPLVPLSTIVKLCHATKETPKINCQCSVCFSSGKYRNRYSDVFQTFSTYATLLCCSAVMGGLVYYIKTN